MYPLLMLFVFLSPLSAVLLDEWVFLQCFVNVLNPNGQYGNVPLLHALVSGFYLVYLALLIHWSNFADMRPSLATRWGSRQPLLR